MPKSQPAFVAAPLRSASLKPAGRVSRSGWTGLSVALLLHAGLLIGLAFVKGAQPVTPEADPFIVHLIDPIPSGLTTRQSVTSAIASPAAPSAASDKPAAKPRTETAPQGRVPAQSVPLPPDITPIPASPQPAPPAPTAAPGAVAQVPDQKQVMAGLSARNAAAAAIIKRDICVNQRNQGRELDKDCPLITTRQLTLGPRPKEDSDRQKCIRKRREDWQKYRDGTAAYPGLINMFKGNSDCRKGWD